MEFISLQKCWHETTKYSSLPPNVNVMWFIAIEQATPCSFLLHKCQSNIRNCVFGAFIYWHLVRLFSRQCYKFKLVHSSTLIIKIFCISNINFIWMLISLYTSKRILKVPILRRNILLFLISNVNSNFFYFQYLRYLF